MKLFYLLLFVGAFLLACTGCDAEVDVTPTFTQTTISGRTVTAFRATINGVEYFVDDAKYTCVDLVLYTRTPLAAFTPASTCVPDLFTFTTFAETDVPLYSG